MVRSTTMRWGWLVAAAAVAVGAFLLAGIWQGGCAAGSAAGGCTSGPVLGVPGTVAMVVLAAAFVVFAVVRAFRKRTG